VAEPTSSEILDALRGVIDPEMGINIVDLGLVYETAAQDGDVHVVMTMTTAACPLGESMAEEAAAVIRRRVPGATSVSVQLVWEPAWQPSMMSAAAREQLGWK
jgi:metal-sulfur cluster biosynthetic enzyme